MRPSSKRLANLDEEKTKETRRSSRLKAKEKTLRIEASTKRTVFTPRASAQRNSQSGSRLHQTRRGGVNKHSQVHKSKNVLKPDEEKRRDGRTGSQKSSKDTGKLRTLNQETEIKSSEKLYRKTPGSRETPKKMKATYIRTFSGENTDDSEKTRFCDVAFIDDNHVLVLDDKHFMWQAYGCRACCYRLDGTLLAETLLPGYPWSAVVLSPTEAVVTIRDTDAKGLVWLSIDTHNKSIEIVRNVVFENTLGIACSGGIFIASHFQKDYMTVLDAKAKIVGKIPVESGRTFRCLSLDDNGDTVLYSDFEHHKVNAIDRKGNIVFSLPKDRLRKPSALAKDSHGNIYVGNSGDLGASNVVQFARTGKYVTTLCTLEDLHGIDVNTPATMMAISHEHFISIYRLTATS